MGSRATPDRLSGGSGSNRSSPARKPVTSAVPLSQSVYLAVKDSLSQNIESIEEFDFALQHAGTCEYNDGFGVEMDSQPLKTLSFPNSIFFLKMGGLTDTFVYKWAHLYQA